MMRGRYSPSLNSALVCWSVLLVVATLSSQSEPSSAMEEDSDDSEPRGQKRRRSDSTDTDEDIDAYLDYLEEQEQEIKRRMERLPRMLTNKEAD